MEASYKNILVTTDFSDISIRAFEHVHQLVGLIGEQVAQVTVLNIFEDMTAAKATHLPGQAVIQATGVMDSDYKDAIKELDALCAKHFSQLVNLQKKTVRTAKAPHQVIVEFAKQNSIDVIVMSSAGRNQLGSLLLGSTAERVLRHAPCPVLLIPNTKA